MDRQSSKYINMRRLHGSIKKSLVEKCVPRTKKCVRLFDVSVGRFGDLHNYYNSGIRYIVGIDPDQDSIAEAKSRYTNSKYNLTAVLDVQKISDKVITLPPGEKFDIVTCNFTMHYLFESEEMLTNALTHISKHLKPNGYFICTTIVGDNLGILMSNKHIHFEQKFDDKGPWGQRYTFNLLDNASSGNYFNNCIQGNVEYKVSLGTLIEYAKRVGLKLSLNQPFSEFPWDRKAFSPTEKLVSGLYQSLVFIKTQ
jgi:mRNA (guanine-N7-)-methyltransferase